MTAAARRRDFLLDLSVAGDFDATARRHGFDPATLAMEREQNEGFNILCWDALTLADDPRIPDDADRFADRRIMFNLCVLDPYKYAERYMMIREPLFDD